MWLLCLLLAGCGDDDEMADGNPTGRYASPRDAGRHEDSAARVGASTSEDAGSPTDAAPPMIEPIDAGPPPPPLAAGVIGAACGLDGDCAQGRCQLAERITSTPYPGGYCTGPCSTDAECTTEGLCVPGFRGATGSCARRCERDYDCGREGYRCRVIGDAGRCAPGPRPLPDHAAGAACASDMDCGGGAGTCSATLAGHDAPGGYCTQPCSIDGDCGDGGVCINGIMVPTLPTGVCYSACASPADCRAGFECRPLSGTPGDRGVCAAAP